MFLRGKEAVGKANNNAWAHRLSTVRVFARWLHSLDARHEVLPQSLIPGRARRPHAYIYSEGEIRRILQAAAELPSTNGIRPLHDSLRDELMRKFSKLTAGVQKNKLQISSTPAAHVRSGDLVLRVDAPTE